MAQPRLLLYTVGYESRSAHIACRMHGEFDLTAGLVVSTHRELHFEENLATARARHSELLDDDAFEVKFSKLLNEQLSANDDNPIALSIDVSSMSRAMMASAINIAFEHVKNGAIDLEILYAPGEYQAPKSLETPFLDLSPLRGLEGWSVYPERPLSMILGLGYEIDHASAAVEYLDPSGRWVFMAEGADERFEKDVLKANDSLTRIINPSEFVRYNPYYPSNLFSELLPLVETLESVSRVAIIAGGPKIFSAIAILIKLLVGTEVSIWNVSAHKYAPVRDTKASGDIVRFNFKTQS